MAYFILGAMIGAAIGAIAISLLIAGKLSDTTPNTDEEWG
jgi:gas vesicle protein